MKWERRKKHGFKDWKKRWGDLAQVERRIGKKDKEKSIDTVKQRVRTAEA